MAIASTRLTLSGIVQSELGRIDRFKRDLQTAIQAEWRSEARQGLDASAQSVSEYVAGIIPDGDNGVQLIGTMANMLEQGLGPSGVGSFGAFDLRDTILKPGTRNMHHGAKGDYVNVPFKRTAAQIKALGAGNQGPRPVTAQTAAMERARGAKAYKAAAALDPTDSVDGQTVWGGRLPPGKAPKIRSDHHSDPLAALYRFRGLYSAASGVKGQSTYGNFRTISRGGKAWIHPGIAPRDIASRVVANMNKILETVFG